MYTQVSAELGVPGIFLYLAAVLWSIRTAWRVRRSASVNPRLAELAPMGSATNFPGAILTRQEKTVMGTYYGGADPARDFPFYADLYLRGKLPLDKLISMTWPLEKINEAFAEMLAGNVARGVIVF